MPSSSKFLIEKSRTRIYQRINESFAAALTQQGHQAVFVDPTDFQGYQDYLTYIQAQDVDYCLIPNARGLISKYIKAIEAYVFELTEMPLIFIHHDNCFRDLHDLDKIYRKIQAFQKTRQRSFHFCLEYHNFIDLRGIGIENTYPILHASEFTKPEEIPAAVYDLTFLGHVVPKLGDEMEDWFCSHRLRADFWTRLAHLDHKLEPSAIAFAQDCPPQDKPEADFLAAKYFYNSMLHSHSQHFRGELIRRIDAAAIDIIGGDPAYLHGSSLDRRIQKENVRYHPPTEDYGEASRIYTQSKINLNITSLQFDQAVINRVIDVGAAGGFVLTDWKSDLLKITSVADEISYRTIDELNYKIAYYLHPDHAAERLEIAEALHQDVKANCTYATVVDFILNRIFAMPTDPTEPIKLDLGCGPWKAPGFIGVDVAPNEGVDVVADLNQRFPFATSTVDWVRAHDVVEHLENRIHTMNEIWRICKPGGMVDIRVPSTDGRGAFQDPTHVSFWNINSFKYYCVEFPNYLKLCHTYGFRGAFSLISLSEETSDDQVIHVKAVLKAIKPVESEPSESEPEVDPTIAAFKLRQRNVLVRPDWQQPEAELLAALSDLLKTVILDPESAQLTLLIDADPLDPEEVDAAVTSVVMHLMAEEAIELPETGPEISLLSGLSADQWQSLLPYLSAQIVLDNSSVDRLLDPEAVPAIELSQLQHR